MKTFDVITLFPELFTEHLNRLPFKKGLENNLISINLHNLRDHAIDKHGTVDEKPYGGGTGMILMVEPIHKALENIQNKERVVLLSASGRKYDQKTARDLLTSSQITLICGRYEGVDARVAEHFATDVISIGDYVLSGGELPALVIMESIVRLIPGIIEKEEAVVNESFTDGYLEYPQYTRPENYKDMKVPEVLLSGDHKKIEEWRKNNRIKIS
jgi:tRNA (guanine37-N1)-methyltransferase